MRVQGRAVLVTGGAGYLGSVLVPALLDRGARVTVLDVLEQGPIPLWPCAGRPGFSFVHGDATDEGRLAELLPLHDAVIPLAGLVGAPACDREPDRARAVNLGAIESLIRIRTAGQVVVFPATNSGYGRSRDDAPCTEESPLRPLSLYARTKVEAEAALLATGEAVSLRLATVFGLAPRPRTDLLVNDFTLRAFRGETIDLYEESFRRNFVHVRDVAAAFLMGLDRFDAMKGEAYNVGLSDANLTKRELCERIRAQVPSLRVTSSPMGRDPDRRDYVVSNRKIEALGWRPTRSLDDGIRELLEGYRLFGIGADGEPGRAAPPEP